MLRPVERIVELLDPRLNQIHNMSLDEARRRVLAGDPADVRSIDGSFALIAVDGVTVEVDKARGVKCERCWRYVPSTRQEPDWAGLCDRCVDALAEPAHR